MINKIKGQKGEDKFSKWLSEQGITKSIRNSSSGSGIIKSDCLNDIDINFEVKTIKKSSILKYYQQSKRDAEETHTTPYVVIHTDTMPKDEWLMVINNWDWLDLYKKDGKDLNTTKTNTTLIWLLKSGIDILKKIIKELEKIKYN